MTQDSATTATTFSTLTVELSQKILMEVLRVRICQS